MTTQKGGPPLSAVHCANPTCPQPETPNPKPETMAAGKTGVDIQKLARPASIVEYQTK